MEERNQPLLASSPGLPVPSRHTANSGHGRSSLLGADNRETYAGRETAGAARESGKLVYSTFLVVLALIFIQTSIGLYVVLAKEALQTGMDAGTFVLLRDTITAALLLLIARIYLHHKNKKRPAAEQLPALAAGEASPLLASPSADYSRLWLLPAPKHRLRFIILGILGVYFGQYVAVLGLQSGTPVLSATFSTATPLATFLLGLIMRTEPCACTWAQALKVCGVLLAVAGAVVAIVPGLFSDDGGNSSNPHNLTTAQSSHLDSAETINDPVRAGIFFTLQVILGGACFWHLQKSLLSHGYSSLQTASWYYGFGALALCLAVAPTASQPSTWQHLHLIDAATLGFCVVLYPLLCFMWTWANKHSSPTFVMAFSPLQIGTTCLFDFILYGHTPSVDELAGGGLVVAGIIFLVLGQVLLRPVHRRQALDSS